MSWKEIADRVIEAAGSRLIETTHAGASITSVFWYGAVDIDPQTLTVWVMVSGLAESQLPQWYAAGRGAASGQPATVTPDLLAALDAVAAGIRHDLAVAGWPEADHRSVLFDASERVKRAGWSYFKG